MKKLIAVKFRNNSCYHQAMLKVANGQEQKNIIIYN